MSDKGKTILILGNGFDLAHGLPTRYSDFLEFCQRVTTIWTYRGSSKDRKTLEAYNERWIQNWNTENTIRDSIIEAFINRSYIEGPDGVYRAASENEKLLEIYECLNDNVWYDYLQALYEKHCMRGENWIDFESEIRFIIKSVDENTLSLTDVWSEVIEKAIGPLGNQRLEIFKDTLKFSQYSKRKNLGQDYKPTVRDFREKSFVDLEHLTRAFELYLIAFVEKISINERIPEIVDLNPDYVITFNYTNTYERLYKKGKVYHIHGKTDETRPAEENNMVLGIDEYWMGDEKNEKTNFTIFKKFSQRIQKHTGNAGYKYLREIQKIFRENGDSWHGVADTSIVHPDRVSYVYVFGHSLDVTDKDILSSFIGDDSTAVTVYCRDRGTEGELIANTIQLISEEKLLDKSNHAPEKLKYILQKRI